MVQFFTRVSQAARELELTAKMNQKNPWPLEIYDGAVHLFSVNKVGGVCIGKGYYGNQKARDFYDQVAELRNPAQDKTNSELQKPDEEQDAGITFC